MSNTSIEMNLAVAAIANNRDLLARAATMLRAFEATGRELLLRRANLLLAEAADGAHLALELKNDWCYPVEGACASQSLAYRAKNAVGDLFTELDRLQRLASKVA